MRGYIAGISHSIATIFSSYNEAHDFLSNYKSLLLDDKGIPIRFLLDGSHLNISAIQNEIYNRDRFSEISIILVDYAIPHPVGLNLCEEMRDQPFKKILFLAVPEIFENKMLSVMKIVDDVIGKGIWNFDEIFKKKNFKYQMQYFQEIADKVLYNNENVSKQLINSALFNSEFIKFFDKVCRDNDIVEYYLFDKQGSYTLIDYRGNISLLVVKHENIAIQDIEFVLDNRSTFTPETLNSIIKHEIIFCNGDKKISDYKDPEQILHPATNLLGSGLFYCALIKDLSAYDYDKTKIFTYWDYLNSVKY